MKQVKYICDRCGKEIGKLHKIEVYRDDNQNWLVTTDNDFCEKCAEKIVNFALSKQSIEKKTEHKINNEKFLDTEKIYELWNLQWSVHKIAIEMGVEDNDIAKILNA